MQTRELVRELVGVALVGVSVFNGFMSTFLSVLPVGLGSHFTFRLFFKSWFCILLCAAAHALVLLPVLLSFTAKGDEVVAPEELTAIKLKKEED